MRKYKRNKEKCENCDNVTLSNNGSLVEDILTDFLYKSKYIRKSHFRGLYFSDENEFNKYKERGMKK